MNQVPKVLICTSFPDRINTNPGIRHSLALGFAEVLGAEAVQESGFMAVLAAAQAFRPDLLVAVGSCMPKECDYLAWRRYCDRTGCRFLFWLTDDPYEFDFDWKVTGLADLLFSSDANSVLLHERPDIVHLPLAASPHLHWREVSRDLDADLFFCGVAFANRQRLLRACEPHLAGYRVEVSGAWWPKDMPLARNQRLSVERICDRYNHARLTLNLGRSLDLANNHFALAPTTPGPRTFEAALAGAVQAFHADGLEIVDYLEPGREILLFDTPLELAMLIEELRDDPERRHAIACASQQRCLAEHTYARRARAMLDACRLSPAFDQHGVGAATGVRNLGAAFV